jgi:hypothetical protein
MIIEARALVPGDGNLLRIWCGFRRQSPYLR